MKNHKPRIIRLNKMQALFANYFILILLKL